MKYQHILAAVLQTPWAIRPEKLTAILELITLRASGGTVSADEIAVVTGAARSGGPVAAAGGVLVLPVLGTIMPRAGMMSEYSGGVSVQQLRARLREAMTDPAIGSVVLDIDSPGGSVTGIDELATEIATLTKPVVAYANGMAASAAYWLASAATEVMVTPSGEVGSIGVIAAHEDLSAAYEQAGIRTTLVTAGAYKAEANPFEPLAEEARAAIQADVDRYYDMFVHRVAVGRKTAAAAVRSDYGEGRMVGAPEAKRRGMVDRIGTLDDAIRRAAQLGRQTAQQRGAAAADARLRWEIETL